MTRAELSARSSLLDAFLKRNPDLAEAVVLKHLTNQMSIKGLLQAEEGVHA